jgi:hypothetical protein
MGNEERRGVCVVTNREGMVRSMCGIKLKDNKRLIPNNVLHPFNAICLIPAYNHTVDVWSKVEGQEEN